MRNNRTTVRSLVTSQGTCLAMSDGLLIWETPSSRRTLHLRTMATAILGVQEDNVTLSKLYVGDKLGQLHIVQLPDFSLVSTGTISHAPLRAMCMTDNLELLIADAEGRVWSHTEQGKSKLLFETNRSISSIRSEGNKIRIQSGWEQCTYNSNGTLSNSEDASNAFGDNLMLRRMRERKAIEAQRREAEAQLRLLPSA
ncbi:MAG: hypothetical protein ACPHX9_04760 [Candidatus Poseidoniaceae archaeon]